MRDASTVKWLRGASLTFVALSLLATAGWSWFFKDGLGPSFVPSTRLEGVDTSWGLFWVPVLIGGAETLLVLGVCRRRLATLRSSFAALEG